MTGRLAGDVNLDGQVDVLDALSLARADVGLDVPSLIGVAAYGDVTGDKTSDVIDAVVIARHSVGMTTGAARVGVAVPISPRLLSDLGDTFLAPGESLQLPVTVVDQEGRGLTGYTVTYAASDASVATAASDGLLMALAAGTTTVSMSVSGGTATTFTLRVLPRGEAVRLEFPYTETTLFEDASDRLTPLAFDADDEEIIPPPIVLTSADPAVLTVMPDGRVEAKAVGRTRLTARAQSLQATADVLVESNYTVSASGIRTQIVRGGMLNPGSLTLAPGGAGAVLRAPTGVTSGTFNASAPGLRLQSVNATPPEVQVFAEAPGPRSTQYVHVTLNSPGALNVSTVTITPIPVARIDVAPTTLQLRVGESAGLTASAFGGGSFSGRIDRTIEWSLSNRGAGTIVSKSFDNRDITLTAILPGDYELVARVGAVTRKMTVRFTPLAPGALLPLTTCTSMSEFYRVGIDGALRSNSADRDYLAARLRDLDVSLAKLSPQSSNFVTPIGGNWLALTAVVRTANTTLQEAAARATKGTPLGASVSATILALNAFDALVLLDGQKAAKLVGGLAEAKLSRRLAPNGGRDLTKSGLKLAGEIDKWNTRRESWSSARSQYWELLRELQATRKTFATALAVPDAIDYDFQVLRTEYLRLFLKSCAFWYR